jgi:Flp pilus assembly protein TadD
MPLSKKPKLRQTMPATRTAGWRRHALILMVLAAVTLGIYWPIGGHEFVTFDDYPYVVENPHIAQGLTGPALAWAFSLSGYASNWHPLTWISHMLDIQLFGLDPAPHHWHNVLLHTACALLLYWLLHVLTHAPWRSAFVAALFALHPLHVESVAWVAERKDVLSTFFWVLALLAYVAYARRPAPGRYLACAVLFALGLLTKPMVVTFPLLLLLLDWWPLGRLQASSGKKTGVTWPRLILEKVPLLVLSVASSYLTIVTQDISGAIARQGLTLPMRIGNAIVSYAAYIGRMFWPARLSLIYPHPGGTLSIIAAGSAALFLALATILALKWARRRPYFAVGWFWYLITLLPVIGLIQVGFQGSADRYTYVPLIGLFMALTWGICELAGAAGVRLKAGSGWAVWLAVPAVGILLALSISTRSQLTYWQNSETLYGRALQVAGLNDATAVLLIDLGVYYERKGLDEQAAEAYRKSLEANPDNIWGYRQLGTLYLRQGRYLESLDAFLKAQTTNPDNPLLLTHLGSVMCRLKRYGEAIPHLRQAVRLGPQFAEAHAYLGMALMATGDTDPAIRELNEAVRLRPELAWPHWNLAEALCAKSEFTRAWEVLQKARQQGLTPPASLEERLQNLIRK